MNLNVYFRPFGPLNKYFRDYFPLELVKTADLDPNGKYLLCSHPHGAMPAGINIATMTDVCGWNEKFPGSLFKKMLIKLRYLNVYFYSSEKIVLLPKI